MRTKIGAAAIALFAMLALMFAPSANAASVREPASGGFNCTGVPVAFQHETANIHGSTGHRVGSFWVGASAQSGWNGGGLTHVTFREQDATQSLGGTDNNLNQPYGFAVINLNDTQAPYHVGSTYAAFDISTWSPVGDIHHRCKILM